MLVVERRPMHDGGIGKDEAELDKVVIPVALLQFSFDFSITVLSTGKVEQGLIPIEKKTETKKHQRSTHSFDLPPVLSAVRFL